MSTTVTPAVRALKRESIHFELLEYEYDPDADAIGMHAAQALGRDPSTVFKTLIVTLDAGALACAVIPANARLDRKALAAAAKARKCELADPKQAERATGYVVGGISPLGQRKPVATFLDSSALGLDAIVINGGRRGLQIVLSPRDLVMITAATVLPLQSA